MSKAKHAVAIAEGSRKVRSAISARSRPRRVRAQAGEKVSAPPFLLRSRPDRLWAVPPDGCARPSLRCRSALADPQACGRACQTNRRDAVSLARLLRAGELTGIWVPDDVYEAIGDLVRVRAAAGEDLRKKRQQLVSFLLRHGRIFSGRKNWSRAHARWLAAQKFDPPAQQIVFQDQVDVITDAEARLERLDAQLAELVDGPVVAAYQALRGASVIVAVTFLSEVGDVRRFDNPRQLMAFLGLVPSERSTGNTVKRGSLTLAGNRRARRVLV